MKLALRLGRKMAPDPRDHNFPMRSLTLGSTIPDRHYRYSYANGWWGDQGNSPQCVAYAWLHWLEDGPVTQPLTPHRHPAAVLHAGRFYHLCQQIDEWPGSDYDGTSVRAGAKVAQQHGFISNYYWAFDAVTAVRAILNAYPVVMGTWWRSGMWWPDHEGRISYTGSYEGGHAWVANGAWIPEGYSIERAISEGVGYVRGKNSWGRGWGRRGHFYLPIRHFDQAIVEDGEACVATEVRKVLP